MKIQNFIILTTLFLASCTATKKIPESNLPIDSSIYDAIIENHRENYKKNFIEAETSPLKEADLEYLQFYPAKEQYKVRANFVKTEKAKPFWLNTSSGKKKQYVEYGKATFTLKDTLCTIALYKSLQLQNVPGYKDYLFIPFKDYTSGETTYGGGRYLDLRTADIIDNQFVTIDFNLCYNPYCAYQPTGWNCPIPPDDNYLKIYIEAGEKIFLKH